jgi:hypothetical protein
MYELLRNYLPFVESQQHFILYLKHRFQIIHISSRIVEFQNVKQVAHGHLLLSVQLSLLLLEQLSHAADDIALNEGVDRSGDVLHDFTDQFHCGADQLARATLDDAY